ncbi:hypothetical protein SUGI_0879870 [Cryptomeria japonica]|nr:hypothetical protein SUGI_0879870 [Cryptomeria japonica]
MQRKVLERRPCGISNDNVMEDKAKNRASDAIPADKESSGGIWSFGRLVKVLASKLEQERSDPMEANTSVVQESLKSVGQVTNEFGSSVWRGTTDILTTQRTAFHTWIAKCCARLVEEAAVDVNGVEFVSPLTNIVPNTATGNAAEMRRLEAKDGHLSKQSKITRDRDRDFSKKIALGMANTGGNAANGGEVMYDQRLFNQEKGMESGFATDDQYTIYDKAHNALSTLYRSKKDADSEILRRLSSRNSQSSRRLNVGIESYSPKGRSDSPNVSFERVGRSPLVERWVGPQVKGSTEQHVQEMREVGVASVDKEGLAYFHQQLEVLGDKYLEVSPRAKTPGPSLGNDSNSDSSFANVAVAACRLVAKAQAAP